MYIGGDFPLLTWALDQKQYKGRLMRSWTLYNAGEQHCIPLPHAQSGFTGLLEYTQNHVVRWSSRWGNDALLLSS